MGLICGESIANNVFKIHPWIFVGNLCFPGTALIYSDRLAPAGADNKLQWAKFQPILPSLIRPSWLSDSRKHLSSCRIPSFAMDLNHVLKGKHYRGVLMNWSLKPHIPQSAQPGFWNRSLERCTDACGFPLRWGFWAADYIAFPIFFLRE